MGQNVITPEKIVATIATDADVSDAFNLSKYASGTLLMCDTWTAAGIGFMISDSIGGTYIPLVDAAGDEVEVAAAAAVDTAYPMPAAIFGNSCVKLWSQTAGTGVAQLVADRVINILVKE